MLAFFFYVLGILYYTIFYKKKGYNILFIGKPETL
jgi:hypothetical protein